MVSVKEIVNLVEKRLAITPGKVKHLTALMKKGNMIDAKWLAGFFDGEGCVCMRKFSHNASNRFQFPLDIHITQNESKILKEISLIFGGSVVKHPPHSYRWCCPRNKEFINYILPHSLLKKRELELALEYFNSTTPIGKHIHNDNFNRRLEIYREIKNLKNKKEY